MAIRVARVQYSLVFGNYIYVDKMNSHTSKCSFVIVYIYKMVTNTG